MRRHALAGMLLSAALLSAAPPPPARALANGENAGHAGAVLLQETAPATAATLQARFPGDYQSAQAAAATLAMMQGTGAADGALRAQAAALLARAATQIKQREGDAVIRAPEASLRPLIEADHALFAAAAAGHPAVCPALLSGQATLPDDPALAAAADARTAALLTAIADARDHPITARRATPDDYRAFTTNARRNGIAVGGWAVLSPNNLVGANPTDVCAALTSVDATVLAMHDEVADRILADLAAVLVRQGS